MIGLTIDGVNFYNICYTNDTALIATSEEKLQALLDQLVEVKANMGLPINCAKTKSMVVRNQQRSWNVICKSVIKRLK